MTEPPRVPDKSQLLRLAPQLKQVREGRLTWHQLGEMLVRDTGLPAPRGSEVRMVFPNWEKGMRISYWDLAKGLVHSVLGGEAEELEPIRTRLRKTPAGSTAALSSMVSLWLAGQLSLSVTITNPLVAVMLYAVAEAGGDADVLAPRDELTGLVRVLE